MNAMMSSLIDFYPKIPFQQLLGVEVVTVSPNSAVVRLPFKPELVGGGNAFHGGAISSLLDLTGALAAWSGHDPEKGMKASTVTLTTNYVAAAQGADIIATATVSKRGKELIFCHVIISEEATSREIANGSMIYRIV